MIHQPFISASTNEEDFIGKASSIYSFPISHEELCQFFDYENFSKNERLAKLRKMGGISGLQNILRINIKEGINSANLNDLISRIICFGDNLRIERKPTSFWEICSLQFEDKIYKFLLFIAVMYCLVDVFFPDLETGLEEGVAILVVFLFLSLSIITTTYVKYKKYLQVLQLAEFKEVRVIRNNKLKTIPSTDLVVGDLMFVQSGDIIPIDCILFDSPDTILCNEFGCPVYKRVPSSYRDDEKSDPFLLSGAKIIEGHGTVIVCAVGKHSKLGRLKKTQAENGNKNHSIFIEGETKLMKKVGVIYSDLARVGLFLTVVTFLAMLVHFFLDNIFGDDRLISLKSLRSVLNMILIVFAIIMVVLPEGLGIALTSALTYSIVKLRENNSLVRFFSACETLGYVNNIVCDQTGIFTKNKMTVASLFVEENVYNSTKHIEIVKKETIQLLCECICINSSANPIFRGNGEVERQGDEIECSLLEFAYKLGYNYDDYRPSNKIRKMQEDNNGRFLSTLFQCSDYEFKIFSQGVPSVMLRKCNYYINYRGERKQMNEEFREYIDRSILHSFSQHSLKPVLLAYKDVTSNTQMHSSQCDKDCFHDTSLTFIALVGVKDPLRNEIPAAISLCNKSGITLRMVTNDSIETAISIAKDSGILPINYEFTEYNSFAVMEGKDFRQYVGVVHNPYKPKGEELNIKNLAAFEEIISELRVLAKSTPEDKYLLISGLKELGNVVALSGNGADDVKAMQKADVGFVMGASGSDIAKEVADVILLDDNFSGIIDSIKWGRNIFDIVRKFLYLVLCSNLIFISFTFVGSLIYKMTPLTAFHMIWIDLLLNIMSSIALATEAPPEDSLSRGPFIWTDYLIPPLLRITIILQFLYGFSALLIILFLSDQLENFEIRLTDKKKTILFNTMAFLIIFNQINTRIIKKTDYNIFKNFRQNKPFFLITMLMISMQIIVVQYGGKLLECVALNRNEFLLCVGIGFGSILMCFFTKILPENAFRSIRFFNETEKKNRFGEKLVHNLMGKHRNVLM